MNNKLSQLPKYLQWVFTGLEGFVFLGMLIVLGLMLTGGRMLVSGGGSDGGIDISLDLGRIKFELPEDSYAIESEVFNAESILLEDVVGKVAVNNPRDLSMFMDAFLLPMGILLLFGGGMVLAIVECFRRFFRSVRYGESFQPKTVANLHKIGVLVIVLELGLAILSTWLHLNVGNFLSKNMTVTGIETQFHLPGEGKGLSVGFGSAETHFRLNLSAILGGLMLMAIGEAFRQGAVIKREHELTI